MEPVEINVAYHSAREVSIDETRVSAKREQAAARGGMVLFSKSIE